MADTSGPSKRRFNLDLNSRSVRDLEAMVEYEELNKSTIVNRAIQVYRLLVDGQASGKRITLLDPETGVGETIRIV